MKKYWSKWQDNYITSHRGKDRTGLGMCWRKGDCWRRWQRTDLTVEKKKDGVGENQCWMILGVGMDGVILEKKKKKKKSIHHLQDYFSFPDLSVQHVSYENTPSPFLQHVNYRKSDIKRVSVACNSKFNAKLILTNTFMYHKIRHCWYEQQ